ncbi:hypothetical protein Tdes44962_MAKER02692 [Teratosphaeria destructans]|uniref:Uncharacterized protein n=1 Tax=Teratosphaeria destructans TaxID=418781 RepID=A0A9W7ST86_9PEZI|nr:hypothetical protein Tdes44962_MAKER02692 [Teratosphaeria destructans]
MSRKTIPPLLRLPAELRNRIYYEALANDTEPFQLSERHTAPALLQVSQQIREESSGIFYSNNIFQFTSPKVFIAFLLHLSQKQRELIPEIRYDCSEACNDPKSWRRAFQDLPGMDEDAKLTKLRQMLAEKGIFLQSEVLKAGLRVNARLVWTADPLTEARSAVQIGSLVGRVMFV